MAIISLVEHSNSKLFIHEMFIKYIVEPTLDTYKTRIKKKKKKSLNKTKPSIPPDYLKMICSQYLQVYHGTVTQLS